MNNHYQPVRNEEEVLMAAIEPYAAATNKQITVILIELAIAKLQLGGTQESQERAVDYLVMALKALR